MREDWHVAPEPVEAPPFCDRCHGYHGDHWQCGEQEVVAHVQKYAKFQPRIRHPYHVRWDGKLFTADDTRELVLKIMDYEER